MKPLSDKALLLALHIHESTERDSQGKVVKYWIAPSPSQEVYVHSTQENILVGVPGDTKILDSLHKRGLIDQTGSMYARNPRCYYSTEELAILLEEKWEWISERRAYHEKEIADRIQEEEYQGNNIETVVERKLHPAGVDDLFFLVDSPAIANMGVELAQEWSDHLSKDVAWDDTQAWQRDQMFATMYEEGR
jgi:hypothetical protein